MKIQLMSDLHFEFREHLFDHIWGPGKDVSDITLLLAGDIDVGQCAFPFVEEVCKHFKNVLFICGNHEFYQNDFDKVTKGWTDYELSGPKNFHFLNKDVLHIDGVRFIGGTMWTSFNNNDPIVIRHAHYNMNDYVEIRRNGKAIRPDFILREHYDFTNFLFKELDKPFDGPTVVMSHHSPGNIIKHSGRGRITSPHDHCYYADLDGYIGTTANPPKLWVHGHTHQSADYMINETRVVCNPYGYWGQATNKQFNYNLILEV